MSPQRLSQEDSQSMNVSLSRARPLRQAVKTGSCNKPGLVLSCRLGGERQWDRGQRGSQRMGLIQRPNPAGSAGVWSHICCEFPSVELRQEEVLSLRGASFPWWCWYSSTLILGHLHWTCIHTAEGFIVLRGSADLESDVQRCSIVDMITLYYTFYIIVLLNIVVIIYKQRIWVFLQLQNISQFTAVLMLLHKPYALCSPYDYSISLYKKTWRQRTVNTLLNKQTKKKTEMKELMRVWKVHMRKCF